MKDKFGIAFGLALIDFLSSFVLCTFVLIGYILGIRINIFPNFDFSWYAVLTFWILLFLLRFNLLKYLARKLILPKPLKNFEILFVVVVAVVLQVIVLYLIKMPIRELLIYTSMGLVLMSYHLAYSIPLNTKPAILDKKRIVYQSLIIIIVGLIIQVVVRYFQSH